MRPSYQGSRANEEALIEEMNERTDRARRSVSATLGTAVQLVVLMVLPHLPGARSVFRDFDGFDAALLGVPAMACVFGGALAYHLLGPRHAVYQLIDACELCALHGFPAFFPLLDGGTSSLAGGFLIFSAAFWGQSKPGRPLRFGALVGALAVIPVGVFLARGNASAAAQTGLFGLGSMVAFTMSARARRDLVRAQTRRDHLLEEARASRIADERVRIQRELTEHMGTQLERLADQLASAGLPEAASARGLSRAVSDLVFPEARPVLLFDVFGVLHSRCVALWPDVRLTNRGVDEALVVTAEAARAVLRLGQELVRNSVVHSRARGIDVVVEVAGTGVRLVVNDDGVGLTQPVFEGATGGLRNAKNWTTEVGGTVVLTTPSGGGTTLTVTLPGAVAVAP